MRITKALLIIIIAIGFTSCIEIHCPAFPKELKDLYFPYSTGEVLTFTNSNNDTLEVKIENSWTSDSHSFSSNCDCACSASAQFDTETANKFSLKIRGSINYSISRDKIKKRNYYLECEFQFSYLGSDSFATEQYNFTGEKKETAIFGDTIFIEKQECYRIGSVKIVKNKGIVEFWDKQQDCNWVKYEKEPSGSS